MSGSFFYATLSPTSLASLRAHAFVSDSQYLQNAFLTFATCCILKWEVAQQCYGYNLRIRIVREVDATGKGVCL
ncbi:hypothetical protein BU25DRAFT_406322 [Macroventuria anomochaeta]|uniref:Uncharacterized protein n=1 Tax=Macroventuria anomochaeta TaxID=301207 RepID=A0ACB6SGB2_9PLEO|nr:uncharacterized protein BU25DRAFT_406322 [Macroventuria anomochaeta]KAF2633064.1 hypothetical protein BU25DRAFT_406322 [Macroventuria anomochaeta]